MQQNLLLRDHPRAVRAPLPATLQYACHVYLDGKQSADKHEVDADQHFLKESIMNKRDRLESGLLCNSYPTHIEESFHRSQEEEWKKLRVQPRSAVCISKLQCQNTHVYYFSHLYQQLPSAASQIGYSFCLCCCCYLGIDIDILQFVVFFCSFYTSPLYS